MDRDTPFSLQTGDDLVCRPLNGMPTGFTLSGGGIHFEAIAGEPIWVCSPMTVPASFCDPRGRNWGRVFEVMNRDGVWISLPVTERRLGGSTATVRADLGSIGLRVSREKAGMAAFVTLLSDWHPHDKLVTTERLGWTDTTCSSFVLGSGRSVGAEKVLPMGHALTPLATHICSEGTLENWRKEVAAQCIGNPLLLLALSSAFVGPLLELLGLDMGGGLHLRGASSCGKSTILRAANSVWGSPHALGTWRATANGLERAAAARNSMLLVLDEMAEISAKEIEQSIYMLANGSGKTRMSSDGTHQANSSWRLAMLSSGEIGVADKLQEASRTITTGIRVRLVDIEADGRAFGAFDDLHGSANGAVFADCMKDAAALTFGVAGPAFVAKLMTHADAVRAKAGRFMATFVETAEGHLGSEISSAERRVIQRFALIAFAGKLATAFGVTGWGKQDAENAALDMLSDWHDRTSGPTEQDRLSLIKTRSYISEHVDQLALLGDPAAEQPIDPIGWRGASHLYVPAATWQAMHPAGEGTEAARSLQSLRVLLKGDGNNLTHKAPRGIVGRPRVYVLNLAQVLAVTTGGPANGGLPSVDTAA